MKYSLILMLLLIFCGCERGITKVHNPNSDIKYTIVVIEGKEWLATKGSGGFWYLSGPLNVLTIEKEPENDRSK
jgi:hypothetical protein